MAERTRMSGIAGMGEAEELLSFENNNNNNNINDPRMTPVTNDEEGEEDEQDDNVSYGSMSMSRSSRRRQKRKNKKNTSSNDSIASTIVKNSNPYLRKKEKEIELILSPPLSDESNSNNNNNIDLWKLRELALTPGGLVNDTLRKRAWPKLVGLDHNYDPLQFDDILPLMNMYDIKKKKKQLESNKSSSSLSSSQKPSVPTIEIDAEHELLQANNNSANESSQQQHSEYYHLGPPSSTLLVESMDMKQIDRDVARCTWHLLTGSQRSRRSQHKSITQNSTRGGRAIIGKGSIPNTISPITKSRHHSHSAKYRRNRKISILLKKKQRRLANLINLTLVESYDRSDKKDDGPTNPNNRLRYYQGYHDVACIFLHALGGAGTNNETMHVPGGVGDFNNNNNNCNNVGDLELPSKVLCQISFSHFGDALQSDFLKLQTGLKLILFPLLRKLDREVHDHLLDADMEPYFCLSWIITWYAHDIRDTNLVKRLFDAFIVGHPLLPVYTALSMMTHPYNRRIILETDCDFAALHQCLASLPKHSCQVGYKKRQGDGYNDNIITYVSDDDEEEGGGIEETIINTSAITNSSSNNDIDSCLDEEQSEFDDDTIMSNCTNDDTTSYCGTESSFPTSIADGGSSSRTMKMGSTAATGSGSLASGSLASLQHQQEPVVADRTVISTEEADFISKDSNTTLVSGSWGEPWVGGINTNTTTSSTDDTSHDNNKNSNTEGGSTSTNIDITTIEDNNPVPFESVLDTALQYMKKYPPNSLVEIAKLYYSDDWDSQISLLSSSPNNNSDTTDNNHIDTEEINVQEQIALLNPHPPPWSIVASCTSDWIEKQKLRFDLGLKPTSRNDRRRRRNQGRQQGQGRNNSNNNNNNNNNSKNLIRDELKTIVSVYHNNDHDDHDHDNTMIDDANTNNRARSVVVGGITGVGVVDDLMEYVRCHPEDRVVAAIGYGPGMEGKKRQRQLLKQQRRRRRRRRTLMVAGGCGVVFIGVLATTMGGKAFYDNNDSTSLSSSLFSTFTTKGWLFSSTSLLLVPSLSSFSSPLSSSCPSSASSSSSSSSSSCIPETATHTAGVVEDYDATAAATMKKAADIILPRLQNTLQPSLSKQPQQQQQQLSSGIGKLNLPTPGMVVNKQPKTMNNGGDNIVMPTSRSSTNTMESSASSSTTSPSPSTSTLTLTSSSISDTKATSTSTLNVIKLKVQLRFEKTKQFMMKFIQHVWGFCRIFFSQLKNLKIIHRREGRPRFKV